MQIGRRFGLSEQPGEGVYCSETGVFVGGVPLLERLQDDPLKWRVRSVSEINHEVSRRYRLPVELNGKLSGLAAIAEALNRGDLLHAQIVALHLQLPDPLPLAKSVHARGEMIDLARQLRASGLLKADWDPAKHPRWPAGTPDGVGGEFAPAGTEAAASIKPEGSESNPLLVPTQGATTLPIPFRLPGRIPLPSEVLPPPAIAPNIDPFTIPQNPYPERRRCVREWAEATRDCLDLWADGLLGTDDYREWEELSANASWAASQSTVAVTDWIRKRFFGRSNVNEATAIARGSICAP